MALEELSEERYRSIKHQLLRRMHDLDPEMKRILGLDPELKIERIDRFHNPEEFTLQIILRNPDDFEPRRLETMLGSQIRSFMEVLGFADKYRQGLRIECRKSRMQQANLSIALTQYDERLCDFLEAYVSALKTK